MMVCSGLEPGRQEVLMNPLSYGGTPKYSISLIGRTRCSHDVSMNERSNALLQSQQSTIGVLSTKVGGDQTQGSFDDNYFILLLWYFSSIRQ